MGEDKLAAYQTLYQALVTIAKLASPIAPFFSEQLFRDLNQGTNLETSPSVHLTSFPVVNVNHIDKALEERMQLAQQISSMVLSLRKRSNIRVRQPLQKIMIPVAGPVMEAQLQKVSDLIRNEVNIKEITFIAENNSTLVKKAKPNFKALGPRYGKLMKEIAAFVQKMSQEQILEFEHQGSFRFLTGNNELVLETGDLDVITEDIPGWVVATEETLTVALDITITAELALEGVARDFVNRVQNLRKELDFDVIDRIIINVEKNGDLFKAIEYKNDYICSETLAEKINWIEPGLLGNGYLFELDEAVQVPIKIEKA
jgi:isoleucyl-tRNA synthetase